MKKDVKLELESRVIRNNIILTVWLLNTDNLYIKLITNRYLQDEKLEEKYIRQALKHNFTALRDMKEGDHLLDNNSISFFIKLYPSQVDDYQAKGYFTSNNTLEELKVGF